MLKSFLGENNENRNSVINSPRVTYANTDLERAQIRVNVWIERWTRKAICLAYAVVATKSINYLMGRLKNRAGEAGSSRRLLASFSLSLTPTLQCHLRAQLPLLSRLGPDSAPGVSTMDGRMHSEVASRISWEWCQCLNTYRGREFGKRGIEPGWYNTRKAGSSMAFSSSLWNNWLSSSIPGVRSKITCKAISVILLL